MSEQTQTTPLTIDQKVDAVIASSGPDAYKPEPKVAEKPSDTIDQVKPETETKEGDQSNDEPDNVPFPKKAVNALSRRDKQIGKLRAEKQALEAQIAEFQAKNAAAAQKTETKPAAQSGVKNLTGEPAPVDTDFTNYGEYLTALMQWTSRQEFAAQEAKRAEASKTTELSQQEQAKLVERQTKVIEAGKKFVAETPDALQLLQENADLIDDLPPAIERIFLETDNAPLAMYNLIKTGQLENLATLTPEQAALVIGRAEAMGATANVAAKISSAPPPPSNSAKGSGSGSKSHDKMSYPELKKIYVN